MDRNVVCALLMTFILYTMWTLFYPRRRSHPSCPRNARHAREMDDEFFENDPPTTSAAANYGPPTYTTSAADYNRPTYTNTSAANDTAPIYTTTDPGANTMQHPTTVEISRQSAIDFSDLAVTEEQRAEMIFNTEQVGQVQSVNERYDAAKRKVTEHKLKPGVYDNKQRRKLVEALLRRPACGRRVRSWRTENSDTLRGDTVPKTVSSWGLMRLGGSNPAIDLHPGALGALSGMEGKWISEENIPDNAFDDLLD